MVIVEPRPAVSSDKHVISAPYADLRYAELGGADLSNADLRGIRGYVNSHVIFAEAVRRQPVATFTSEEWVAIAQVVIHTLCWDAIQKRFSDEMATIFEKLAAFPEWKEKWEELRDE